jgi:predicted hotdog family 3-hydroxylacyl-ACP dehydratase
VLAPWFRVGDRLVISAALAFRDEQMAVFDCTIAIDGQLVADARLNVYQPEHDLLGVDEGG